MGSGRRRKRDRGRIEIPRAKRIVTARDGATVTTREGVTVTAALHENGKASRAPRRDQCKTFGLVRTSEAATRTAAGMSIWGVFKDPNVTVRSQSGDLGDVPSQAAHYFIEERNRLGGGSLKGFVLKSTPHEVRVRLCLT
jgi:hypothetical protein